METTKEEREGWLESEYHDGITKSLCRDVDTLVAALRKLEGCADWESEDVATLNVTEFRIALDRARELLRDPQAPPARG